MAVTDSNIDVTKVKQDILISTSTSFKVQNLSNMDIRFRVAGSSVKGGIIAPKGVMAFDYDIEVWGDIKTGVLAAYVVRD